MVEKLNTSSELIAEPTIGQQRAAELLFMTTRLKIFEEGAESALVEREIIPGPISRRTRWLSRFRHPDSMRQVKEVKALAKELDNEYFRQSDPEALPYSSEPAESILRELRPRLESAKEEILAHPEKLTIRDRRKAVEEAASVVTDLSPEQRARMLTLAGFDKKEIAKFIARIGISAAFSVWWGSFQEGASWAGSLGIAALNTPEGRTLANPQTWIDLGVSYGVWLTTMAMIAETNVRFFRDKLLKTTPSLPATIAGYLTPQVFPESSVSKQNWAIRASSVGWEAVKEGPWILAGIVNPTVLITGNYFGSVFNLAEMAMWGTALGVSKIKQLKEKRSKNPQ